MNGGAAANGSSPVISFRAVEYAPHQHRRRYWTFDVPGRELVSAVTSRSAVHDLVRLIIADVRPASGEIRVLGVDPVTLDRLGRLRLRRRMGVALQREGLVANLTLRDNLILPPVFTGRISPTEARTEVEEVVERLGLEAWMDRRPQTVPPEIRTVAAVIRAALARPELLVLERPAGSLPASTAQDVLEWARERSESTLVLATHRNPLLEKVSDSWLFLGEGVNPSAPDATRNR